MLGVLKGTSEILLSISSGKGIRGIEPIPGLISCYHLGNLWESMEFNVTPDLSSVTLDFLEKEVNAWQNDTSDLKMTAGSGKSFKCDQDLNIVLQGNVKVTVTIKKMQLQPFPAKGEDDTTFGEGTVLFRM